MPSILGGGLSGLTAAYYLSKNFITPLVLYESSNRLGGWIHSQKHSDSEDSDYLFEYGPRTIRPKGIAASTTLQLIEELNLAHAIKPISSDHPAATKRLIYVKNKLHLLPSSIGTLFKTIPPFSKPLISGLFNDLKTPAKKQQLDDESIYNFVERRFGFEIAEYAVSSMISGICAGDAKEISARFLMNDFFELEQKYGGIVKGIIFSKLYEKAKEKKNILKSADNSRLAKLSRSQKWSIYTLQGGLETLPHTIAEFLSNNGVLIKKQTPCNQLTFKENCVEIECPSGSYETDHVISALPAHKLAQLVDKQHPSLSYQLKTIPYVDVAVINLKFEGDLLKQKAFGFLVPPAEQLPILGIIFDSCCFDIKGSTVLTVMMGGKWFNEHFGREPNKTKLLNIALENIEKILEINSKPQVARVNILRNCIPQYTVGHRVRVEGIRNYIKRYNLPLTICGAAYDGVGINDVILSAKSQIYSVIEN